MIRRPSYKQFLHQTKEVQSSINLSFNDNSFSTSKANSKPMPTAERPWENRYIDAIKYLPDDPRTLRHTYVKQTYGRSAINESFTKSFQVLSPNRQIEHINFKRTINDNYARATYRDESKKEMSLLENPLEFTKCYVAKPIDTSQASLGLAIKSLYQSKSTAKLQVVKNEEDISKEIQKLKDLRNRRMQNNAQTYRYEEKLQNNNANISKQTVNIAHREDKENKLNKPDPEHKHKRKMQRDKKRQSKSKSPIQLNPTQKDIKGFVPIQFKKKESSYVEQERPIIRQASKSVAKKYISPLKTSKAQICLISSKSIRQFPKSLKIKSIQQINLQDFILGKKLGEGRFGMVWVATHKLTGGLFALKKISKSIIKENFMIEQFILEVKIQSFIENPFIVKIYATFDDKENIYLLLQYLEGGTLYNILKGKGKGKLSQQQASIKISMICQAVNCLHEKGIAHRDIKPENIIITNEICKLADFGWATFCDQRRRTYCGTTDYVAPQIVEGLQYDMSVDLWCIGVLAYELLSGRAPFYHISRQETFNKIKNVDHSSINYPEYFSSQAADFIGKLIKKNPNQRMLMNEALRHPFITKYHL